MWFRLGLVEKSHGLCCGLRRFVVVKMFYNFGKLDSLAEDELDWVRANCVAIHVSEPVYVQATGTKRKSAS